MSDDTVPDTERNPNGWQMQRFADIKIFPLSTFDDTPGLSSADGKFPSAAGHVAFTTLLAYMQTFMLLDVLEDLRSPAKPSLPSTVVTCAKWTKEELAPSLLSARVANRSW